MDIQDIKRGPGRPKIVRDRDEETSEKPHQRFIVVYTVLHNHGENEGSFQLFNSHNELMQWAEQAHDNGIEQDSIRAFSITQEYRIEVTANLRKVG